MIINHDIFHGVRWSEETKARVKAARAAGRTVEEMFGHLYKNGKKTHRSVGKSINRFLRKKSNRRKTKSARVDTRTSRHLAQPVVRRASDFVTKTINPNKRFVRTLKDGLKVKVSQKDAYLMNNRKRSAMTQAQQTKRK